MASIFKRLFKIGEAEAHSAIDKLEDPIKMTENAIRDLKKDLDKSLHGLAEVKSLVIRTRREIKESEQQAADYERKAIALIKKAQNGELAADQADRLASEALNKKEETGKHAATLKGQLQTYENQEAKMQQNVNKLKSQISTWENELRTLKARYKVSSATEKLNKQMAKVDSSGTIAMLEKMRDRVNEKESLAESYADIAGQNTSVDDEIDDALNSSSSSSALDALKGKINSGEL